MKKKLEIAVCLTCSFFAVTLVAQDNVRTNEGSFYSRSSYNNGSRLNSLKDTVKASDLLGLVVKNYQQEKLGKVDDMAVDTESGRVVELILSTGGFLGMGSSFVAVPAGAFNYDTNNKVLTLDASREKIAAAPKFDSSNWDEMNQSNQVVQVNNYYGQQSYFIANGGDWTTNTDGSTTTNFPRNMDGTINTLGPRTMDTAHNKAELTNGMDLTDNAAEIDNSSWSKLGYIQKGSTLIGMPVKNQQDEKLGKVDNFIVSLPSGRIVALIISTGGFLGIDNELSAVPPGAFKLNGDRDTLQLNASKESLTDSPHFKSDEWPDFSQPGYAGKVYSAYNVRPYFNTNSEYYAADNTGRNMRDRDTNNLTPFNQSNSQADINITARIRREIVADKSMSVNAMNIKIITVDGRVTLRGPVNSPEEKSRIEEIARRISQDGNVVDQLEVQPPNQ